MDHPTAVSSRHRRPRPIRWLRAHATAADWILATILTVVSVAFHLLALELDNTVYRDPAWWTVPLVIASVVPIAKRRSNPVGTALTVAVAQVISSLVAIDGSGFIGVIVAMYSLGAHCSGPRRTRTVLAIAPGIVLLFVAGLITDEVDIGAFISTTVVLVTAFVLGDNLRRRRDAAQALQDRLERAERERELIAHQRVTAERTRIARELHDVVAHSVSVMVIQAAAARRNLRRSPDSAERALENIEVTGRQTMNELRSVLGVLRRSEEDDRSDDIARPAAELAPQPTLAAVTALVAASADLPILLRVDGELADLASSIDLTGFRIVQEALTNTRRHAGPVSTVDVSIRRTIDRVEITVADDGRGTAADDRGPGYGLVGMRERVDAIGGELSAGARRGGGWQVDATLPTGLAPTTDDEPAETIQVGA